MRLLCFLVLAFLSFNAFSYDSNCSGGTAVGQTAPLPPMYYCTTYFSMPDGGWCTFTTNTGTICNSGTIPDYVSCTSTITTNCLKNPGGYIPCPSGQQPKTGGGCEVAHICEIPHQHPVIIPGGEITCAWDETQCAQGAGWYPGSHGICHPTTAENCPYQPGFFPNHDGVCLPEHPDAGNCPQDWRYNPTTNSCIFVGDLSGEENPQYPPCAPNLSPNILGCYPPDGSPIIPAPPFCQDVPIGTNPLLECRNPDGSDGHPPLSGNWPPPQNGDNSPYTACPVPLPLCAPSAYTCINPSHNPQIVPKCTNSTDGSGNDPIGGGNGDVDGGGIAGGGANGGSTPDENGSGTYPGPGPPIDGEGNGGEGPYNPQDPNEPPVVPDPNVTDSRPGTSGGVYSGAEAPKFSEGRLSGYSDARNYLCPTSACSAGPTCDDGFCSASERLNRIASYKFPTLSNQFIECPNYDITFQGVGLYNFGHFSISSHCYFLEHFKSTIQSLEVFLILIAVIIIVLSS